MDKLKNRFTKSTLQKFKKIFWSVFSIGIIVVAVFEILATTPLESQNPHNNTPKSFDYLPTSTTNQIIKHDYYTLSYNEKYEQAEWVAYELKKSYVKNNHFKRPYFIEDQKYQQALLIGEIIKNQDMTKVIYAQLEIWNLN